GGLRFGLRLKGPSSARVIPLRGSCAHISEGLRVNSLLTRQDIAGLMWRRVPITVVAPPPQRRYVAAPCKECGGRLFYQGTDKCVTCAERLSSTLKRAA